MPNGITIVGLGPGPSDLWTQAASAALKQATVLYLRTTQHPAVIDLPRPFRHFDHLFERIEEIETVYAHIAAELVAAGQVERVIYAVPGHPALDDPTLPYLRSQAQAQGVPLRLIPGLSLVEAARAALQLEGDQPLQIVQATAVAARYHPPLEADQPALINQLYPTLQVTRVKQTLLNAYPKDYAITLIHAPGSAAERVWTCPLAELDRQPDLNEQTLLYLPPNPHNASFSTFQNTIAHLRAPEGCPWDRQQTHQSLRPYLLEETYEVLEALDAEDTEALAEELGDLLLQIVLHTQIAIQAGEFQMGEVLGHIQRKMLRRHPHVFGEVEVSGAEEVVSNWEAIKKAEKAAKGRTEHKSVLDGIPPALPALAQTLAICQRVARVGFEWPTIQGVLDKLLEEAQEISQATDPANLAAEIGDFLFNGVNLARWHKVEPESALRAANARFSRRFRRVEALAVAQGRPLSEMTLAEMQALWEQAKAELR